MLIMLVLVHIELQNNSLILQKGKCRYAVEGRAGYCSRFHILPQGDEETLKATVAKVGPVAVAMNARLPSFHLYRGGELPAWRLVDDEWVRMLTVSCHTEEVSEVTLWVSVSDDAV